MKNKLSRGLRLGLLTALATCGIGAVNAAQVCYTDTHPGNVIRTKTVETLSVDRFDPTLGTLNSVAISLGSTLTASDVITSLSEPPSPDELVNSTVTGSIFLTNELGTLVLLGLTWSDSQSDTLAPGAAVSHLNLGGTVTDSSVILSSDPSFGSFIGSGKIILPVGGTSSSGVGGANAMQESSVAGNATVTVCYNYTPPPSGCVHSLCYWKTHCSTWPVDSLTIGCKSYTKSELLKILSDESSCGNRTLLLAQQLIVAELNIAGGADGSCIREEIATAEALLCSYKSPGCNKLIPNTSWDSVGCTGVLKDLKDFNSGLLCTPTCDETKPHDSCPPKKDGCDKDKDKDKDGCDKDKDKDKGGCDKDKDKSGDKSGDKSCKKS